MENQCVKKKYIFQGKEYYCSLELAMDLIGGKWKSMMIFHLKDGALRSSDLQRSLQGISNKMFTQTARELEGAGLIERIIYPVVPPKVEYRLTELGQSVLPIVLDIAEWGIRISEE
ncbi:MAG: helix-turn-helix domain-containing protein [Bacteroides sp.]|nr:helix-turn-helix domain-containing protein [Bacteroides sp.]